MAHKNKHDGQVKKGLAIGSAVVAGLGAIAGAYFLYGTEAGKKKRKEIRGWMLKAKGEVLERIENVTDLTEEKYKAAVTAVMKKYDSLRGKYGEDAKVLYDELMSYWNHMKKHQTKNSKGGAKKKTTAKKSSKK